ncbi:GNAT family N-acetyltransferase [Prosthecobacter sp.]|uniref:GNAT family N-acetyltransferase n=1 Tax=Prosthecobacter sp. TaxID=1965333 RepID=UPI003783018E
MKHKEWINPPCPFLPEENRHYDHTDIEALNHERGPMFYETALHYAQSLWREGFPAKSILILNRALSLPLSAEEPILAKWPLPYLALIWIMQHRVEGQFIGNPRRHWQHLATRMVEPNKELRTWRAWACWYLAQLILPEAEYPSDQKQIREEQIVEPTREEIAGHLHRLSPARDEDVWRHALSTLQTARREPLAARIRRIGTHELVTVQRLGHEIWHAYYPGIISEEQIRYMLSIWYQPGSMAHEMQARDVWYALVEVAGPKPVGYISFEKLLFEPVLFINKLYILPEVHGHGLGGMTLRWAEDRAKELRCRAVRLRVNKRNATAIRSYLRAGFRFTEDIVSDIGSGFVMDDYVMEKGV